MGKQRLGFLSDFVEAITRRTRGGEAATLQALARPASERARVACTVLMGRIGDAARVAVAEQALRAYAELDAEERLAFFRSMRDDHGVDAQAIRDAYAAWDKAPDAAAVADLFRVVEPARQTLLRRLNLAPGATLQLVRMRQDLLAAMRADPGLVPIDQDFAHLLASWFNRGFLSMRRIDWNAPAAILEKLMAYESVHPMQGWGDLKRRLAEDDRRLYAFFHPATGDEPLIFVEVALTRGMPDAIGPILTAPEATATPEPVDTAVFYSINNSLAGLKGVSFGNFLIKQVVAVLKAELPELTTFVTLSPVPGFAAWLAAQTDAPATELRAALMGGWSSDPGAIEALRPQVMAVAARYILQARGRGGQPADPVARFHLGNGASAHRLNWPADLSDSAQKTAHGLMINYLYELDRIEDRHEAFIRDGTVAHGPQLAEALKG